VRPPEEALVSVILGQSVQIDDQVQIGYPSGRLRAASPLVIGDQAHIRSGTVIYVGSRIGLGLQTGHNVTIREQNVIGAHLQIWNNSTIDYGCWIGSHVKIHNNVYVSQYTIIEDDAFLAPGVIVGNDIHPGCAFSGDCMRGPHIKRGAQIGVNATLLPFVTIGEGALIGAGSVVTRDVPAGAVAYGNPARVARDRHSLPCTTGITDNPYPSSPRP